MLNNLLCIKNLFNEALKRAGDYVELLKTLELNTFSELVVFFESLKMLTEVASIIQSVVLAHHWLEVSEKK